MRCPKCGSENVFLQQVETGSIGTSHTTITRRTHGLLYWIFIGWWIWIFKLLLLPFRLLFGHKKKIGTANTVTGTKTIHRTAATCQNCGHSWTV